jgi:2-amino-4-hydroxy-6-hydroxymethyldihydropteridine diphosphokinase
MTYEVYLSVGSNINPRKNVLEALRRLDEWTRIKSISPVYLTRPVQVEPGAENFHNLCVKITADRTPENLKNRLRELEKNVGRDRSGENSSGELHSSRAVDVDILLYEPEPTGFDPHPQVADEAFVVYPLSDLLEPSERENLPDSTKEWRARCDESTIIRTVDYKELDEFRNADPPV